MKIKKKTYVIVENRVEQIVVLIEIVHTLLPEVSWRQNQTIVFGKQIGFVTTLHVLNVQAHIG